MEIVHLKAHLEIYSTVNSDLGRKNQSCSLPAGGIRLLHMSMLTAQLSLWPSKVPICKLRLKFIAVNYEKQVSIIKFSIHTSMETRSRWNLEMYELMFRSMSEQIAPSSISGPSRFQYRDAN